MISFVVLALQLHNERLKSLINPKSRGFTRGKSGVFHKILRAPIAVRSHNSIRPLGQGLICYSDQDPKENTPEAELVRSRRWAPYQVGRLCAIVNGQSVDLAQVDPTGLRPLGKGFITEKGEFVIDLE